MNEFLLKEDFLTELNYIRFFFGLFITMILVYLVKNNYLKNSFSNDNKKHFSNTLLPFALSMLLIVSVIKTSLALSLGLVGALSIIRFRTAIKETEQIISLLIVLAISIAAAAEKEILAVIVTVIYIFLNKIKKSDKPVNQRKLLLISFKSDNHVMLKDLEILQINRFYKTSDGMYTVEYFFDQSDDVDKIILDLKNILKTEFEYEIN